jgi:hypothetical protein
MALAMALNRIGLEQLGVMSPSAACIVDFYAE